MLKGFVILMAIGLAFAYFVFNFVGDVERSDSNSYVSKSEKQAREWAKYYTQDVLGRQVLDLKGAPMQTAREVWVQSRLREEMLEHFPDFEMMRQFVHDRLRPSPFRKYLLEKIDETEGDYLAGTIDTEKAKKILTNL